MSGRTKSLAPLIAIVGLLAVASYASLVNGESRGYIAHSLSELGHFDSLDWVKVLRSQCKTLYCDPDKAFELLKTLDKIYGALDKDAKTNGNEQKIIKQFEINQIDGDQFCTGENLREFAEISYCYDRIFPQKYDPDEPESSVGKYLRKRLDNFASVCRTYVLKNLNKRVGDLNETDRHDMEETLGNKLVSLRESNESLVEYFTKPNMFCTRWKRIWKFSPRWQDILLEFLKEKSGNNLDAKCYITTGDEGWKEFNKLFHDSIVNLCWRWRDATREAQRFQQRDRRQREFYTERQANWMKYAEVCFDITFDRTYLAESLYSKLKSELSMFPSLKLAMNRKFKKMSHAGVKSQ